MTEPQKLTPTEIKQQFDDACGKLEKYDALWGDPSFEIQSTPEQTLKELEDECSTQEAIDEFNKTCAGLTTFGDEVKQLKTQILYNKIVDEADAIYAEILRLAKLIIADRPTPELTPEDVSLIVRVYIMGIIKSDLDDEKEMNEELAGKKIYPSCTKVEPITDEDALKRFLLG